ncbi:MAG: hypothetical protein R3200_09125 [Xanthomonadales bacterium]|nr:hypothetical protein [Xanthomonadales bacterium]
MLKKIMFVLLLAACGSVLAQDFTRLYPDVKAMEAARRSANSGDYEKAHEYYLEAAEYGNKEAQKLVGLQYMEGQGVEADPAMALAWLRIAGTFGDSRVRSSISELEGSLDADALKKADKHQKKLEKDYGDKAALKERKKWARREVRGMGTGSRAGRPNPMEQAQIQIDGRYYRIKLGEAMDAFDEYVDDFEKKMKG